MILLLGATGTVGSHVADLLAGRGDVRALVRSPKAAAAVAARGIEPVHGDLARPETLPQAFAGADALLLVTPFSHEQAELERGAIDAAAEAGVGHVVKVSARDTAPGVEVAMTAAHREAERHLAASGLASTVLDVDWYASNYLEQVELIRGGVFAYPHPDLVTAVVDVRDLADVAARCLLEPPPPEPARITVTGPETLTFREIGEHIAGGVGRPVELVEASVEDWHGGLIAFGIPEWQADALRELLDGYARREGDQTSDDVAGLLGRPARSFPTFVREQLAPAVNAAPTVAPAGAATF